MDSCTERACPLVLHIPPVPDSIGFVAGRQKLARSTVLDWFVNRLSYLTRQHPLYVTTSHHMSHRLSPLPVGLTLVPTASVSKMKALAEVVAALRTSIIAVVELGFALAPTTLLRRVLDHHLRWNSNFTSVEELPRGVSPAIYEAMYIAELARLAIPGLPDEPLMAISALSYAQATTQEPAPIRVESLAFQGLSAYRGYKLTLPEAVSLSTADDIRIARRFLSMGGDNISTDDLQALALWKQAVLEDRAETLNKAVGALQLRNDRRTARIRVLFASLASGFSGAEESLCKMITGLNPATFECRAMVGVDGFLREGLARAGCVVTVADSDFGAVTTRNLAFCIDLLKTEGPDLIHLNGYIGPAFVMAANLLGIPFVQHVRTTDVHQIREQLYNASAVICVSEYVRQFVNQCDISSEAVHVVYDGVDIQQFQKRPGQRKSFRLELGIPRDAFVLLMVARFAPNKHHARLLNAVSRLRTEVPELHLVLIGETFGPAATYDNTIDAISTLGISDCVKILGFQADMTKGYGAADVLILCSENEPLGTCALEAMASELPVIITSGSGLSEIVENGINGIITRTNDARGLAEAIWRLYRDPGPRSRIGYNARVTIRKRATVAQCSARTAEIFELALRNRRGARPVCQNSGVALPESQLPIVV